VGDSQENQIYGSLANSNQILLLTKRFFFARLLFLTYVAYRDIDIYCFIITIKRVNEHLLQTFGIIEEGGNEITNMS